MRIRKKKKAQSGGAGMALVVTAGFIALAHYAAEYQAQKHNDGEYNAYEVDQVTRLAELPVDGVNPIIPRLIEVESHWRRNAISSKGAKGLAQIMPETAKKPGLGVKPLQSNSDAEAIRFANDYFNALKARYGDDRLALAAYNCGISCVDRVLKKLPEETRQYVVKIAGK